MEIKNLFDQSSYDEIIYRLHQLTPAGERLWGKMTVSQMMAHCQQAFKVPLSDKPMKRMPLGILLGGFFKKKLYNNDPWSKGLPTAPDFIIKGERDFETEKAKLLALASKFHTAGPTGTGKYPHPFFGSFTPEQWGKSMWKHMDHHLRQFSV